jgi:predicted PurR-regulated permease PerM
MLAILVFIFIALEILPRIKEYLLLFNNKMPGYYAKFVAFLNDTSNKTDMGYSFIDVNNLKIEMQKYLNQKIHIFASIIEIIASKGDIIKNLLSFIIIMPISFFYFLKDWHYMVQHIYECIPYRYKKTSVEISIIIKRTLRNFFHGQFYVVAFLSLYYSILLRLIGVEHYIALGMISGILSFIPTIGALFSCIVVIFISIPSINSMKLYMIFSAYFLGQIIEGYVLFPKFVGKKTGLHPLWILFSFFAGIQLKGTIGALLAIPSAAVIRSLVRFAVDKFKSSQEYKQ